jgi:glycosyltransferase involved in cell wall biosynthesis
VQEAIESLLTQELGDFRLVVVDDGSTDATVDVLERYASEDDRIACVRNPARVGMVTNWKRTFELARELHGDFEYFAWASDHDVWHPRWLAGLVGALDRDDEAVLAYPLTVGIDDHGEVVIGPRRFETRGVRDRWKRLERTVNGMAAGTMVYGLYRARALEACGVFHHVLLPDRLLLGQLSLFGSFVQVPENLWYRRYRAGVRPSYARQRASFFPGRAPFYSYLAWWITHTGALGSSLFSERGRPPEMGRGAACLAVCRYARHSLGFDLRRRLVLANSVVRRARRSTRAALVRARGAVGRRVPFAHTVVNYAGRRARALRASLRT